MKRFTTLFLIALVTATSSKALAAESVVERRARAEANFLATLHATKEFAAHNPPGAIGIVGTAACATAAPCGFIGSFMFGLISMIGIPIALPAGFLAGMEYDNAFQSLYPKKLAEIQQRKSDDFKNRRYRLTCGGRTAIRLKTVWGLWTADENGYLLSGERDYDAQSVVSAVAYHCSKEGKIQPACCKQLSAWADQTIDTVSEIQK